MIDISYNSLFVTEGWGLERGDSKMYRDPKMDRSLCKISNNRSGFLLVALSLA